jgi:Fur family peroxide stress response transcriptional regulator
MDISPPAVEQRLTAFRRRCADLGLALTPQRLAIYQLLAGDDSHPGAEDIFRRLKPALPSLSLGTVYRNLELLEEHGLVSRVHTGGGQARFDANLNEHHHFICVRCRRVLDYEDPQLSQLPIPDRAADGFRVLTHHIQFLGFCRACQEQG